MAVHRVHLVPLVAVWFSMASNRVFLNSFAQFRFLWKGEGSQWSGFRGIRWSIRFSHLFPLPLGGGVGVG